jgi:RND family efflux transporter MFP subunit
MQLSAAPGANIQQQTDPQHSFQGITEPFRQATISASFASTITEIIKTEGSSVHKGDTILKLDYKQAELEVQRTQTIAQSEAELEAATFKAALSEQDYHATKALHDSTRSISDEEFWKKELEFNLTRLERDRIEMIKAKEILECKIAQDQLCHFFILAPFNGIVAQLFLHESESCKPQEPLIHLVDIHKCRFVTFVPYQLSNDIKKGKEMTITLEGSTSPQIRKGIVEFISPVVDQSSGLRTVKIVFENSDNSIQPGVKGSLNLQK